MLYSFFRVITRRLNFICRRFRRLSLSFHWLRPFSSQAFFPPVNTSTFLKLSHSTSIRLWRWNRQSVPKRRHIKFRRRGITQKKGYNIQNTEKILKSRVDMFLLTCCYHTSKFVSWTPPPASLRAVLSSASGPFSRQIVQQPVIYSFI